MSGRAWTRNPHGRLNRGFVSSAGYVGTALAASVLLAIRHVGPLHGLSLQVIGALILLTVLLFVRNAFGAVALSVLGLVLLMAGLFLSPLLAAVLYCFFAVGMARRAVRSLRSLQARPTPSLTANRNGATDADTVAGLFGGSPRTWAGFWLGMSLAFILLGLGLGLIPVLHTLAHG